MPKFESTRHFTLKFREVPLSGAAAAVAQPRSRLESWGRSCYCRDITRLYISPSLLRVGAGQTVVTTDIPGGNTGTKNLQSKYRLS